MIEDFGLIGDTQAAGLVGRDGSLAWLCLPRFDSGACFSALLGDDRHGCWRISPAGEVRAVRRSYRPGTLVLETEFETDEGIVRLIDCMPPRDRDPDVVRLVQGVRGRVPMIMKLVIRFDYGSIVPWMRKTEDGLLAVAGPDALTLRAGVETRGEDLTTMAEFVVDEGDAVPFQLTWHPSTEVAPRGLDVPHAIEDTETWWREWSGRCTYEGGHGDAVVTSLVVLKALTYAPTGGVVAAATTSLPEQIGGIRNWDYRFCWLRDATFTLYALMLAGYTAEAAAWRDWLLRAVAGSPQQMQILYGVAGERRVMETELDWLPGFEGSRPVRVGNAAYSQFQLDVYGEVMDALHQARAAGIPANAPGWALQRSLLDFLESNWREPDEGIWEVRGPRRMFTHSKVMAWVAFDRAIKAVERFGREGPVERWKSLREEIHREVCEKGFNSSKQAFTQAYGGDDLDASLLMMALVGFLPPNDGRIIGTVAAIERELMVDGFVHRYPTWTADPVDGLRGAEGAFLACTLWLADNLVLLGRMQEARLVFERVLEARNDLGLLAEEYDPVGRRLLGNFPQAFSHVGVINTARNLAREGGPADQRRRSDE